MGKPKSNESIRARRLKKAAKRRAAAKKTMKLKKKKAEEKKEKAEEKKAKQRALLTCTLSVSKETDIPAQLCCDVYREVDPDTLDEQDRCQICLYGFGGEEEEATILSKCNGHFFHKSCVKDWMEAKRYCPVCKASYGIRTGNMPDGTFKSYVIDTPCSGYKCDTIVIDWSIPGGIQREEHPNPGVRYSGAWRTGYLPNTPKGQMVYHLLKIAFERRLMFTVGYSITRCCDNVTIWNGIHAKTSMYGGPWGYPDDTYLDRVTDELAAKGITPADLQKK